jgi:ATP-binding cassette subfamily C protein LapB
MRELLQRLSAYRLLTLELLIASLFINLLSLASSVYVIQIFNRYISYGVDATLVTLTTGVCLALLFEFAFQRLRLQQAENIGKARNEQLHISTFTNLTHAKASALQRLSLAQRQELMQAPDTIAEAYSAANIATLLDLPFTLLFLCALFFISPILGSITAVFIFIFFLLSAINQRRLHALFLNFNELNNKTKSITHSINQDIDTIRVFEQNKMTHQAYLEKSRDVQDLKINIADVQNFTQSMTKSVQALLSIAIYATGASLAVRGEMDIGMLVGANILAMRSLSPVTRVVQLGEIFAKAYQALDKLQHFALVDTEREGGSALAEFSGALSFHDVAFTYPGATSPLFESLSLDLPPASVLVVTGGNSSGKTTLARLIVGLLEPTRGQILADKLLLQQLSPSWWRTQLCYMPQLAHFLPGTIRDNLRNTHPAITEAQLNSVITDADLADFIDTSAEGLETQLSNNADNLTYGQQRRLALARALATFGQVVIFDEPTEGLDQRGCQCVYNLLLELSRQGRTLIVFSQDQRVVKSAPRLLDLNVKPVPQFTVK